MLTIANYVTRTSQSNFPSPLLYPDPSSPSTLRSASLPNIFFAHSRALAVASLMSPRSSSLSCSSAHVTRASITGPISGFRALWIAGPGKNKAAGEIATSTSCANVGLGLGSAPISRSSSGKGSAGDDVWEWFAARSGRISVSSFAVTFWDGAIEECEPRICGEDAGFWAG